MNILSPISGAAMNIVQFLQKFPYLTTMRILKTTFIKLQLGEWKMAKIEYFSILKRY